MFDLQCTIRTTEVFLQHFSILLQPHTQQKLTGNQLQLTVITVAVPAN